MRLAINGMGRIGRLLFRRLVEDPRFTLSAINDIMEPENLAYLLRYDSLYGPYPKEICYENGCICVDGREIPVFRESDPLNIKWRDLDIDIVLECSGRFANTTGAEKHIIAGAGKVLLSTTASDDVPLLIYGHNHHRLNAGTRIISPGGCMTNCITHVLYILNAIDIESAQISIIHSYTSRQELVDTANAQYRRGRAAAESIVPVEIDLVHSLERILPLKGKIAAVSIRVPVANGALADFTIQLKEKVTREYVNTLFQTAAQNEYKGIIAYTTDPVVSADIKGNTHSCIVDGTLTSVTGNQLKLFAWFDNEYGYTSRMIDWLEYIDRHVHA
jgi:glyceraldehyde 3-phosphate dehydrogenase